MGILIGLIKLNLKLSFLVLIAAAIIFLAPGIPPTHINFEAYTVEPAMKPEGNLAPNNLLNNVQILKIDQEIVGPESIALRKDELYTGDALGRLLKIKDGKVSTVAKLGFPCDEVFRTTCSRPLGLRFDSKGKLAFVDIYGGLFRADVDTGAVEKLVARYEVIDRDPVGAPNDLDVGKDGIIYFSDSTTSSTVETIMDEINGHPTGRLLKYDPATNKTTVLIKGIHLANGVQLSQNEDFVLVSELFRFRVKRYHLKGKKKGQSDVFINGLPGMPDNIRSNGKGGFYLSLFGPRPKIDLGPYPLLRRFYARLEYLTRYVTSKAYAYFPSDITKSIHVYVISVFMFKMEEPRNAFILELNENGDIIRSLQSTNSALYGVSEIEIGEKFTYFPAPSHTKIWYINTEDIE